MDSEHGRGSSKHSRKHDQEAHGDDSGSSRHSKTDSDEAEKRLQTEVLPLVFDTTESLKYTVTHEDDLIDLDHHRTSSSSSSSSSSTLSKSSLEDFFQVTFPSEPNHDDAQTIVRKDVENDVTSNGSSTIITSTSQLSDLTHESLLLNLSPAQSPPSIQVMEHVVGEYDPGRIPASIFASKSSSPLEWSTASNESLFSIHVGNNSFSKDQFIMMGANLSGELTKSGELLLFSPTPPVKIVEVDRKSLDRPERQPPNFEPSIVAYESNYKDDLKDRTVYQNEAKMVPKRASLLSSSNSKQSEASGGSTHSFEFPILADGMGSGLLKKEDSVRRQKEEVPPPAASKWPITCQCFSCFSWCHYPRCSCCC